MIRRAGLKDVELIAPLFDRYRQFYQRPGDVAAAAQFLRERLAKNEAVVFFAETNGDALGFVQLYPSFSSLSLKPLWILNDLYVNADARGTGVGRALVTAAIEFARASGAKGLTLKTAIDNTSAQALYQSMGWKRDEKFISFDLVTPN